MKTKKNIRETEPEELTVFLAVNNQPAFRAKQILDWVWKKHVGAFAEMTNLPAQLREVLQDSFCLPQIQIAEQQKSTDGTIKNAFRLEDNNIVEGVLIPSDNRMTACISSQVGCSLTCKFCATGKLDRLRNLFAYEIFDQVRLLNHQALEEYGNPLSNIVLMGMGEPLLNYKNVIKGISNITSPDGLGMSPQRITLSTAGISKMIVKLGDDGVKFNLALSLHAANDEMRNKIMPINEQNSLSSLKDALNYFYDKTGTRVTLEYILLRNFNDSERDAHELANFAHSVTSKINIIEYNSVEGSEFKKSYSETRDKFVNALQNRKIIVNVRRSRGKDIDAACGQLINKNKEAEQTRKFKKEHL